MCLDETKSFNAIFSTGSHHSAMAAAVAAASLHPDQDTDPRELEAFAERFKQRRIKLGKYLKIIFLNLQDREKNLRKSRENSFNTFSNQKSLV